MKEEWRQILGYEGRYSVSNFGRVKSIDRIESRQDYNGRLYTMARNGRILKRIRNS